MNQCLHDRFIIHGWMDKYEISQIMKYHASVISVGSGLCITKRETDGSIHENERFTTLTRRVRLNRDKLSMMKREFSKLYHCYETLHKSRSETVKEHASVMKVEDDSLFRSANEKLAKLRRKNRILGQRLSMIKMEYRKLYNRYEEKKKGK